LNLDQGNGSEPQSLRKGHCRKQSDTQPAGNRLDDVPGIANFGDAGQCLAPGGDLAFKYLPVIAALFGQDEGLLQKLFQRNILLGSERMAGGAEKRNINRVFPRSHHIWAGYFVVQKENQVEFPFFQHIKGLVGGDDL